ncbi:MAG TPA: enoyl-CoA hydratase [Xanthobacteraceae bacterium]|nr:enoyl-CoA hydratase [Xanthobacteraceae bacterium]
MPNSERPHIDVRMEERPHGVVARLTINNARHLNALNSALMAEFVDVLARLAADQKLRAVVLTGAGDKSFIVGADIGEMAAITDGESAKAFITRLHLCCDAIRKFPVPVIARIAGYCFGAGLEIAAACDLRIASETSTFGMQEVKLGIPSVIEAALLPTLVGWGRAREIMLLGEKFSAADALAWGLLERVAPASAVDATVDACIESLMTSRPRAVRLQKRLMRQWEGLTLSAAIAAGIDAFAAAYASDEPAAAMRDFLTARPGRKRDA